MNIDKRYRVGVYIRLSRDDGDDKESESVENQRDIINKFIEEQEDLEAIDEYVDDGYTGTNFDRPSFKRMLKDIENGRINCVITKDLSRFGRDHIDTGNYLERYLPQREIRYIAIGDGVDTATCAGLNFMTFKLSFNDYYSLDISNKIKAVKRRKAEKGEFFSTYAPLGYKKDPEVKNHLIIDEDTAPIVRRIFEMYLSGIGTPSIAKILNSEKVPPPSSYLKCKRYEKCTGKWSKGVIYNILTNEVYIGTVVGKKSYKINHKVKKRIVTSKNERIYIEGKHEPIIEKEDFDLVQRKLKEPMKCRNRQNFNPLKKFIYCGECGCKATMKVHKRQVKSGEIHKHQYFICNKKSEDYYNCSNGSISANVITPIVAEQIKKECSKIVFSKGDLTSLYEEAKQNSKDKKSLITREIIRKEKDIEQIEKKVEEIYTDKLNGIIKAEDFSKFYNSYQEKKEKILAQINCLKEDLKEINSKKIINYGEIKKLAEKYLQMEELDEQLLSKLIDRIEFKGKQIKIKYKFMENK